MRYQILFLFIISSFLISCGGTPETNNTPTNTPKTNSNSNKTNTGSLNTNKTPEPAKVDDATSLKPTIDGFYEALKKKDEADAKKYLSAAALKYWEDEAKKEKKTWFVFLLENEDPVDEKREVRNEQIQGDKAIAQVKGGPLGVWTPVAFIKENGEWKFDSPAITQKLSDIDRTEPSKSGK